jgi:hypothetical protein
MKGILPSLAGLITTLALASACGGAITTPTATPTPTTGGTISALVDGVQWVGSVMSRATLTNGILSVTGQDPANRVISVAVPVVDAGSPGTYSLSFGVIGQGIATMVLGAQSWDSSHTGGEGTFTVATITTTHVIGTFTVTVVPSLLNSTGLAPSNITNGQFDMVLQRF